MAKAGVVQMTKALALELARHSIRVNAIAPGYILTEINEQFFSSPRWRSHEAEIPQRRIGDPGDLDGTLAASRLGTRLGLHDRLDHHRRWRSQYGDRDSGRTAPMDFTLPAEIDGAHASACATSSRREIMPLETDPATYDDHENIRLDLLRPRCAPRPGPPGYGRRRCRRSAAASACRSIGWAAFYEDANRSIFGPVVLNCQAPDDGNMTCSTRSAERA